MSEQNAAATRRFYEECFNEGRLDAVDELVADEYVDHDPQNPHAGTRGPEGVKALITMYRDGFSDLHIEIDQILTDGDHVIARWTGAGTNDGEMNGMPPSGKRSTVTGITIDRYQNGKAVESWTNWDTLGMLQQLGVIPEPQTVSAN